MSLVSPRAIDHIVLLQALSQTLGQDSASGACVNTNEPSGQAQPHRTGGGGAGVPPFLASMFATPSNPTPTEMTAATRTSFFMGVLLAK
jgi:hypothetical protein